MRRAIATIVYRGFLGIARRVPAIRSKKILGLDAQIPAVMSSAVSTAIRAHPLQRLGRQTLGRHRGQRSGELRESRKTDRLVIVRRLFHSGRQHVDGLAAERVVRRRATDFLYRTRKYQRPGGICTFFVNIYFLIYFISINLVC